VELDLRSLALDDLDRCYVRISSLEQDAIQLWLPFDPTTPPHTVRFPTVYPGEYELVLQHAPRNRNRVDLGAPQPLTVPPGKAVVRATLEL